jgi:hypothetical protein
MLSCADTVDDLDTAAAEQSLWDGGGWDPDGEFIVIEGDACWDAGQCFPGDLPEWDVNDQVMPPGGPGGGGPGGGYVVMDPEPDRYKDRKSCFDWCDWSMRQCEKWCRKEYPFPFWNKYRQCREDRCKNHPDPDIGKKSCEADCNKRFPERPIASMETSI